MQLQVCLYIRICIWLLLSCKEDSFCLLMAVVCSTWCSANIGTSRRSLVYATGNTRHKSVAEANGMCARCLCCAPARCCFPLFLHINIWNFQLPILQQLLHTPPHGWKLRAVLLALLCVAHGGSFMLEQPGSSMMEFYEKMQWLYKQVPAFQLQAACHITMVVCLHSFGCQTRLILFN